MPSHSSKSTKTRRSRNKNKKTPSGSTSSPVVVQTVEEDSKSMTSKHSQVSTVSSVLESVASAKMKEMFPPSTTPTTFQDHPEFELFLHQEVGLTLPMLEQLCIQGWTSPTSVVNAFGLNDDTIMQSFLQL